MCSIRSTHIILFLSPILSQALKFFYNLVIRTFAIFARTHEVVCLSASVQAQNDIATFSICEFDYIVINQYTICSKRKIKVLVMRLLELSSIRNEFFAYVPVQKWLATKEINFKILTASGIFDQEVKCLLTNFKRHDSSFATVLTFTRKTVFAVHITSMCDVKTDCFEHRLLSF